VFSEPVVLAVKALMPTAVLLEAVLFALESRITHSYVAEPVVFFNIALKPIAVLLLAVL
jgi:hypothetical protein